MAEEKTGEKTIAQRIEERKRELAELQAQQARMEDQVLRRAAVIQSRREAKEGTAEAEKQVQEALKAAPTPPTKVDWSQSAPVELPTVNFVPPTPQERRVGGFLQGFNAATGKPKPLLVNLSRGEK